MADPRQGADIGGAAAAQLGSTAHNIGMQVGQDSTARVFDENMDKLRRTLGQLQSVVYQVTEIRARLIGHEPQAIDSVSPPQESAPPHCRGELESFQQDLQIAVQALEGEVSKIQSF